MTSWWLGIELSFYKIIFKYLQVEPPIQMLHLGCTIGLKA